MITLLSESTPTARKEHVCMASEFVREAMNQGIFTFNEYRDIIKMKRKDWKIKKGEEYLRQGIVSDGHVYTFKANLEMDYLCVEYDLYPEE